MLDYYMISNVGTFTQYRLVQKWFNQMFLAQVLAANFDYCRLVSRLIEEGDIFAIVDNGAHENQLMSLDDFVRVIMEVRPSVAILRDKIGQPSVVSRQTSMDSLQALRVAGFEGDVMYVPQGRNLDEIVDEFSWAYDHLDPGETWIGYGQSYLAGLREYDLEDPWQRNHELVRTELFDKVSAQCGEGVREFNNHVLGARWTPPRVPLDQRYKWLTSIDTVKPCKCAFEYCTYPSRTRHSWPGLHGQGEADLHYLLDSMIAFGYAYGCNVGEMVNHITAHSHTMRVRLEK